MAGKQLTNFSESAFEDIKHTNEYGADYWLARELYEVLNYSSWQRFVLVMRKAMVACTNSGVDTDDHFNATVKMIEIGHGGQRELLDYALSRYACYLIIQNSDASKEIIALAQTYFAVQTRKQELLEQELLEFSELDEDTKRLRVRQNLRDHNKQLVDAAKQAGVETSYEYAQFQNWGYMGLYGGLGAKQIHDRKKLKKSQEILDHMGSEELASNLFRATQTEAKLRREKIKGKDAANIAHHNVGRTIRNTIQELGGTMPEDLETPEKSIKQIEAEKRKNAQLPSGKAKGKTKKTKTE